MLARRKIKKVHGFTVKKNLLKYRVLTMEEKELKAQRARVQEIRTNLPPFEYGRPGDVDENDKTPRESRKKIVLPDGEQYEGEWNMDTNQRDGRGY